MTQATKRAAVYCRVSTEGQGRDGTSLASQEEACRRYAAELGYAVDERHVYREAHTGAELWERPRLSALREAVRRREVRAVVSYAIDRLSREPAHLYILDDEFTRAAAGMLFVTEELDNTPEGELIRTIKGYSAKVEREKIKERSMRGKLARLRAGKPNGYGFELYGYRRNPDLGVREVHEPEAAVVRRIFRDFVEGGRSLRAIANELNAEGVPSPSSGKVRRQIPVPHSWGHTTVRLILQRTAYRGEHEVWTLRRVKRHNEDGSVSLPVTWRPDEERIKLPTPPLVDEATWARAQRALETNTSANSWPAKRSYLLTGMVYCSKCGRRLRTRIRRDRRVYTCSSADRPGESCGARQVSIDWLEGYIWGLVAEALRDPDRLSLARLQSRRRGPDPALVERLERERRALGQVVQQQERLVRLFAEGAVAAADIIRGQLEETQATRTLIEASIADLEGRLGADEAGAARWEDFLDYCARVRGEVDAMTFEERRLLLKRLNARVMVLGRSAHLFGAFSRLEGRVPAVYSTTPTFDADELADQAEVARLFSPSRWSTAGAGPTTSGRTSRAR